MSKANILAIALIVWTLIICSACNADAYITMRNPHAIEEYPGYAHDYMEEFVDPDTGVHYLLWKCDNSGGMSVRYNADGTIMVTE